MKASALPCRSLLAVGLAVLALAQPQCLRGQQPKQPALPTGRWLIDFDRGDSLELTLKRRSPDGGRNNWSTSNEYRVKDFQGLQRPATPAEAPAHFELVRDAGTITFDGQLGAAGGAGRYAFSPNPEYLAAIEKMGYAAPDADDVFSLAVHDVSRAFIRELDGLGYKHPPLDDMIAMRIHGAGPEFIRELRTLGYDHLSSDDLVAMRIHGATPAFIREMRALGYDHLSSEDLVAMRIHGATPDFIHAMKTAGYDHLSAEDLVAMRIHGATPEFVNELKGLGYKRLSAEDLVSMRIHGVTPDFIRDLQGLGYRSVSPDDLVNLRIHGVSVDDAKRMKTRYKDITVEELVDAKIHARG
ncbi:MAG TPA: 4-hydroxy-3-methylbut-2-enyl diphosphate reductase [Thermoanaerobaculia bacterium]|jgi:hypothetical protein